MPYKERVRQILWEIRQTFGSRYFPPHITFLSLVILTERSAEIANILENSDFIYMLNQGADDKRILAEKLGISTHQLSYVTQAPPGEGLLFFGNVIIPFVDHFPKDTNLYRIMTTKPDEMIQEHE